MTTFTPEQQVALTKQRRQREVRREIVLPMVGGVALLIVIVLISAALPRPGQTSLIADFLMTVLLLCPAVVCVFPLYMLMVLAVFGMGKVNTGISRPLGKLEGLTHSLKARTDRVADTAAQRTISLSSRFAKLDSTVLSAFDQKSNAPEEEK